MTYAEWSGTISVVVGLAAILAGVYLLAGIAVALIAAGAYLVVAGMMAVTG